ncbi:MAG: polysaccharide pyruvyl transferase family protein [Pseudoxanthomonas sp.]
MSKSVAIVSVKAQEDNLGDIEIRSVLLDWITSSGIDVLGYRNSMSDSYMEPFLAYPQIRWHENQLRLQASMLKALARGDRIHFFLAPGPQVFNSQPAEVAKFFVSLANAKLASISGGGAHVIGRAFRGSGASRRPTQALAKLAKTLAVRDPMSRECIGHLGNICPDLAFYPEKWDTQPKRYAVFCLRETDGLGPRSFDAAITAAKESGLDPVFVVQVRRDNALGTAIAAPLGIPVVRWDEQSHAQQLARVEEIYSQAAVVISNRLHGLILGARAGAVPIMVPAEGDTKLEQTLSTAFSSPTVIPVDAIKAMSSTNWSQIFDQALSPGTRDALRLDVSTAQACLSSLRQRLISSLHNNKPPQ